MSANPFEPMLKQALTAQGVTPIPNAADVWTPPTLPRGWRLTEQKPDGWRWVGPGGLSVIVSLAVYPDRCRWLHLSIAHAGRLPMWSELTWAKDTFIGKGEYAVQVFPPRSRWVNLNPHVLHLYYCLDGYPLPEFSTVLGNGMRTI